MPSVQLGGVWKAQAEKQQQLEATIVALQQQLKESTQQLATAQQENADLHTTYNDVLRDNEELTARNKQLQHNDRLARNVCEHLERENHAVVAAFNSLHDRFEQHVQSEQSLKDTHDKLSQEHDDTKQKLELAQEEIVQLQKLYDGIEVKHEKAVVQIKQLKSRMALLQKAKEQKETHLCTLVKDKENLRTQLVQEKIRSSKLRNGQNVSRCANAPTLAQPSPTPPSPRKHLSTIEQNKLAKFTGPNRLKERLVLEAGLRAKAEAEVTKLQADNMTLQVRYRNAKRAS